MFTKIVKNSRKIPAKSGTWKLLEKWLTKDLKKFKKWWFNPSIWFSDFYKTEHEFKYGFTKTLTPELKVNFSSKITVFSRFFNFSPIFRFCHFCPVFNFRFVIFFQFSICSILSISRLFEFVQFFHFSILSNFYIWRFFDFSTFRDFTNSFNFQFSRFFDLVQFSIQCLHLAIFWLFEFSRFYELFEFSIFVIFWFCPIFNPIFNFRDFVQFPMRFLIFAIFQICPIFNPIFNFWILSNF